TTLSWRPASGSAENTEAQIHREGMFITRTVKKKRNWPNRIMRVPSRATLLIRVYLAAGPKRVGALNSNMCARVKLLGCLEGIGLFSAFPSVSRCHVIARIISDTTRIESDPDLPEILVSF